jgi:hypothetical protein
MWAQYNPGLAYEAGQGLKRKKNHRLKACFGDLRALSGAAVPLVCSGRAVPTTLRTLDALSWILDVLAQKFVSTIYFGRLP